MPTFKIKIEAEKEIVALDEDHAQELFFQGLEAGNETADTFLSEHLTVNKSDEEEEERPYAKCDLCDNPAKYLIEKLENVYSLDDERNIEFLHDVIMCELEDHYCENCLPRKYRKKEDENNNNEE
jgi:hypothetical protein